MFKMDSLGSCLRVVRARSRACPCTLLDECIGVTRDGTREDHACSLWELCCISVFCLELAHTAVEENIV